MKFEMKNVGGIGAWEELFNSDVAHERQGSNGLAKNYNVDMEGLGEISYRVSDGKVFCVVHNDKNGEMKTIEVRTDGNLAKVLREKYESVMESRYFGRGGVEVVASGQIKTDELYDLVRLSYNLTISS